MTAVGGRMGREDVSLVGEDCLSGRVARTGDQPAPRPEERAEQASGRSADDILWDVAGVAAYLNVPVSAVYKMTARKAVVRIPHIRLGGKLRFRHADIERWLTLLTVSNLEALAKVRQKVSEVIHGHDSQTTAGQR